MKEKELSFNGAINQIILDFERAKK